MIPVPLIGKVSSVVAIVASLLAPGTVPDPVAPPAPVPALAVPALPVPAPPAPGPPASLRGLSVPSVPTLGGAPARPARAAASAPPQAPRIPVVSRPHPRRPLAVVEIQTVPPLPGAVFLLDGGRLVADDRGVVRTTVRTGNALHRLTVATTSAQQGGRQLEFARWGVPGEHDDELKPTMSSLAVRHNLRIQAAYRVSYLVSYRLVDPAGTPVARSRAGRVAFRSETGFVANSDSGGKVRLPGIRPLSQNGTVVAKELVYDIQSVMVDGSNVIQGGSQRFRPAQSQQLDIALLLRTAHFSSHDLLFHRPMGTHLQLVYPDGTERREKLSAGQVRLENLARGSYQARVDGAGISFLRPVALSRNQYVDLRVVSYLDLLVIAGLAATTAAALLWVGLRRRREHRSPAGPS